MFSHQSPLKSFSNVRKGQKRVIKLPMNQKNPNNGVIGAEKESLSLISSKSKRNPQIMQTKNHEILC